MSDANELLSEAQYALQNVGHGSTDSEKFAAKAKSLARTILRKHADTQEAAAARLILEQLGERLPQSAIQSQHIHKTAVEQHQPLTHSATTDARLAAYPVPGWPLRLLQAVPVVVGIYLLFYGIELLYSNANAAALQSLIVSVVLINFPRTSMFTSMANALRSKILVEEDWYAKADHLPTRKDVLELLRAALQANKVKLAILGAMLFLLNGLLVVVAGVLYVIGARKSLDAIEGWLLDQKSEHE